VYPALTRRRSICLGGAVCARRDAAADPGVSISSNYLDKGFSRCDRGYLAVDAERSRALVPPKPSSAGWHAQLQRERNRPLTSVRSA